jgi:hypothetical protein
MNWWSQAIGLAWRIIRNESPQRRAAHEKREWANSHVSGWELLPLHSKSAGVLKRLNKHPAGTVVKAAMRASLGFAVRCRAPVTVVASSIGATLTEELAADEHWTEIALIDEPLPDGARAFRVQDRLVLAVPRQIVNRYSGTSFDDLAAGICKLRARARA